MSLSILCARIQITFVVCNVIMQIKNQLPRAGFAIHILYASSLTCGVPKQIPSYENTHMQRSKTNGMK